MDRGEYDKKKQACDLREHKYEEIRLLAQSEKSTVHLVWGIEEEQVYVRKILKGRHNVYSILKSCEHPCLPRLYEVIITDDFTTVIEEYIEGMLLEDAELTPKQFDSVVRELCSVLGFLHGKGVIHRDVKPSNIILAGDGHIRLIDFDAARMPKENTEQDTTLLGTRGYVPPEQFGFAQTDERTDIYSLGVTLKQLLGKRAKKPCYRKILSKCTNLNPNKRYQSVNQVRKAFFLYRIRPLICLAAMVAAAFFVWKPLSGYVGEKPAVLPAPENLQWKGESGSVSWDNVRNSGCGDEMVYHWKLYRKDTDSPPDSDEDGWCREGDVRIDREESYYTFSMSFSDQLGENGYYYLALSASGDGVRFTDSAYVVSDAFLYTGEDAPELPAPSGLSWRMTGFKGIWEPCAIWDNLEDYEDSDIFDIYVYDRAGDIIEHRFWQKKQVKALGFGGMWFESELFSETDGAYRFTVRAISSRPNEFRSSPMPDPVPEEYYSPWYYPEDYRK